jgi:hypothetical protein
MYKDLNDVRNICNNDESEKIEFHAVVRMSLCKDSNNIGRPVGGDKTEVQYIIPKE